MLGDIETKQATILPGVPTMWIALAQFAGHRKTRSVLADVLGSGGAPLPVENGQQFKRLTGLTLLGGWGMTETVAAGTASPPDGPDKPGSIGVPLPGIEMEIVALDDPTRVLGAGETGEMRIKGANVTRGYWNRPEETAGSLRRRLVPDRRHRPHGRGRLLLSRRPQEGHDPFGGFNVYPQMIEQAIYEHPDVAEVHGDRGAGRISRRGGQGLRHAAGRAPRNSTSRPARLPGRQAGPHEMPRAWSSATSCRAPRSASSPRSRCGKRSASPTSAPGAKETPENMREQSSSPPPTATEAAGAH